MNGMVASENRFCADLEVRQSTGVRELRTRDRDCRSDARATAIAGPVRTRPRSPSQDRGRPQGRRDPQNKPQIGRLMQSFDVSRLPVHFNGSLSYFRHANADL